MLEGHDIAWLRLELGTELATPRAVFEGLMRPGCLLNWREVFPGLVVARTVSMMQRGCEEVGNLITKVLPSIDDPYPLLT
jgi:hypothetical protein